MKVLVLFLIVFFIGCSLDSNRVILASKKSEDTSLSKKPFIDGQSQYILNFIKNYHELSLNQNNEFAQENYFNHFPNSFLEFINVFGYHDSFEGTKDLTTFSPLYDSSYYYVELFFKLDLIPMKYFSNRLIDISKDGFWQADAVSYFKTGLLEYMVNHKKGFFVGAK